MPQILMRRGTAAQWTGANTILDAGELGVETDTKKFKFGDGATGWNSLPYSAIDTATGDTRYIMATAKGANNGVATLDGTGKIPSTQIPAIHVVDVVTVADQAARLALPVNDDAIFAVQTDDTTTYVLPAGDDPSVAGNWTALPAPAVAGLQQTSEKDAANGYAGLDASGLLKVNELPVIDGGTP